VRRWGWEPTTVDTLSPLVGGLLLGVLVAVLWPARRYKWTALTAGVVAVFPFSVAITVSLKGSTNLDGSDIGVTLLICLAMGLAVGAFIYDYDR
jgi:peptidoglycan/LPS O-acetylase OafA/YrhL